MVMIIARTMTVMIITMILDGDNDHGDENLNEQVDDGDDNHVDDDPDDQDDDHDKMARLVG